jgi:gluconate 2-dehydrogenase alpha chain
MGGRQATASPRKGPYDITVYQSTHNTGGTVMGTDPSTSAVNRYLQSWDVSNLFVIGASNFPQNASYNPTDTVGALAYWAADAIVSRYLKSPGPLMPA